MANQRHKHRVLDVVVRRVAVANALEREPGSRWNSSVKRACEAPNLRVMSEARKEPKASAANSGTVIMRSSLAVV